MQDINFNCHDCDDKLKEERGCEKGGTVPFYIEDEVFFRCPLKIITPLSWEYIKAFSFYRNRILPNHANWADESNKFLSAMTIIENQVQIMQSKRKR